MSLICDEMATSTKFEFAVQMTCKACVGAIENVLQGCEGIGAVSVDLDKEQVIVESSLSSYAVQDLIESSGRRAVLMGMGSNAGSGHLGAAVSMLSAPGGVQSMLSSPGGVQGVTRLVQVSPEVCVLDGTVDGLTPGQRYSVKVHKYGDLSSGCQSCGGVLKFGTAQEGNQSGSLCPVTADDHGRADFRMETDRLKVWELIGRSMVVHKEEKQAESLDQRVACGIIARSAGLFQNPKRICACDGVSLWDERDVPLAGIGRKRDTPTDTPPGTAQL